MKGSKELASFFYRLVGSFLTVFPTGYSINGGDMHPVFFYLMTGIGLMILSYNFGK